MPVGEHRAQPVGMHELWPPELGSRPLRLRECDREFLETANLAQHRQAALRRYARVCPRRQSMNHLCPVLSGVVTALILNPTFVMAEAVDLAKEDQNPLSRFYIMRFEDNAQFGFGPDNDVLNFFRIQPLIPFDLNENWNLVTRAVIPIVHQPWPESTDGLGDVALAMFLTPARQASSSGV